jgi:hypothetical protein
MTLNDKPFLCYTLSFCYRLIVASVPLLEVASLCSTGRLKEYFEKHIHEERGHDIMLMDDLVRLGVTNIPLSFPAACIAGSQYYLVSHEHPAMLLGYMHALESNTMNEDAVAALSKHHGVELKALMHHAKHDPQHAKDIESLLRTLDSNLLQRVLWNKSQVQNALNTVLDIKEASHANV